MIIFVGMFYYRQSTGIIAIIQSVVELHHPGTLSKSVSSAKIWKFVALEDTVDLDVKVIKIGFHIDFV